MANEFVARKGLTSLGGQTFPTRQITASTTFASNDYAIEVTSGSFSVDTVTISLLSGCATVKGLVVGNPSGYRAPHALSDRKSVV